MSLVLKEDQPCPFSSSCPHNKYNGCYGTRNNRDREFVCDLVTEDGSFLPGFRNENDITGKMKIILE